MEISDVDLERLGPSTKHMPLFEKIRDEGHIIEDDFYALQNFSQLPATIVDVGATIGGFSLAALHMMTSVDVLAFEPNVSLRWFHQEISNLFASKKQNYKVVFTGLSDKAGSLDLYLPRIDDWYVIGEASLDKTSFDNPVVRRRLEGYSSSKAFSLERATVELKVFDDTFLDDLVSNSSVVLKIDVEGHEPFVLRGMALFLSKHKPFAIIKNAKSETVDIMLSHGYRAYDYDRRVNLFKAIDRPSGNNAIFIHPDNMPGTVNIFDAARKDDAPASSERGCAIAEPLGSGQLMQGGNPQFYLYKKEYMPALKCLSCGYISFKPPPPDELDEYYNTAYPLNAKSWYNYNSDHSVEKVRYRSNIIENIAGRFGFGTGDIYHEFGCAFGGTVAELKRRGHTITGSELNKTAVEEGRERGTSCIFSDPASEVISREHGKANVVFAFHALEHFSDPTGFLKDISAYMDRRSIIILAVPNGQALDPMVYGYSSYSWFSFPSHLHMWTASSTLCLAEATGYEVLAVQTNAVPVRLEVHRPLERNAGSDVEAAIRAEVLAHRYLGEELIFVMTPKGSETSVSYKDVVAALDKDLIAHRGWEHQTGELVGRSSIVKPEKR